MIPRAAEPCDRLRHDEDVVAALQVSYQRCLTGLMHVGDSHIRHGLGASYGSGKRLSGDADADHTCVRKRCSQSLEVPATSAPQLDHAAIGLTARMNKADAPDPSMHRTRVCPRGFLGSMALVNDFRHTPGWSRRGMSGKA